MMEVEKVNDPSWFTTSSDPLAIVYQLASGSHDHIWNGAIGTVVAFLADAGPFTSRLRFDGARCVTPYNAFVGSCCEVK